MNAIDAAARWICRASLWLGGAACLACLSLVCYAVGARYFAGRPQPWADEVVGWLVVLTVMFAMPAAQRGNEHVAVDAVYEKVKGRRRDWFVGLGLLSVAATSAIMVYEGSAMVAFSRLVDLKSNAAATPIWWVQALVPAGFALLGLVALAQIALLAGGRAPFDEEGGGARIKAAPLE